MRKVMICLFLVASVAFLPACKEETTGDKVDKAVEGATDKAGDAKDSTDKAVKDAADSMPKK